MTGDVLRRLLREALDLEAEELPAFLDRVERDHPDVAPELRRRLTGDDATPLAATIEAAARAVEVTGRPGPGDVVGQFRLVDVLGEGGMSVVYRAAPVDGGKPVSVKILKRGMDTDAILERFRRERRILADLDHPYIARLIDGGSTDAGRPYVVMELVAGLPIDRHCRERKLSIRDRLRLFLRVAEAVDFAHRRLVVHRDLKPANILVVDDGTPKLLDFGIAALLDPEGVADTATATASGRFLTPGYASPEQVRGERVTTASDVYSLTVLLFELLTGRPPYEIPDGGRAAVERVVCETEPRRADTLDRRLRGDLADILAMGLQKDPGDRYGSVQELALDVRRHLRGDPVVARRSTALYRAGKFIRRNPVPSAAAALLTALTVAMTVQTARVGQARDAAAEALGVAAAERDHAEAMAGLLGEALEVSDTEITYLESAPGTSIPIGRGSFTISAWIQTDKSTRGVRAILDRRVPPFLSSRGIHLFTYDDRPGIQIAAPGDRSPRASSVGDAGSSTTVGRRGLADGRWHHVVAAVRRDTTDAARNRLVLYVDGEVDVAFGAERVPRGDVDCRAPLRVGHESDGFHVAYPFQGSIRDPEVFGTYLDSAGVAALHELGLRRRRRFEAHVPSVVTTARATTTLSLVVRTPPGGPRAFTWTVGGRPGATDGAVRITTFDPASGTIQLEEGASWARVPIRLRIPEGAHGEDVAVQVTVVSGETGEQVLAAGTVRVRDEGLSSAGPELVVLPAGGTARVPLPGFAGVRRVLRIDPGPEPMATVHLAGLLPGEPHSLGAADTASAVEVVAGPCDAAHLHELVVAVPGANGAPVDVASVPILPGCAGEAAPGPGAWPPGLATSLPITFVSRTRANAFLTDTTIRFGISTPVEARLEITDLRGRVIRRMSLGRLARGQHAVGWDGRDDDRRPVAPGLYAVTIYGEGYLVARWDDDRDGFVREPRDDRIRTQVFRVRARP